ncbi:fibrillin-2-like [Actinia tenebrosa]|uniref:Fibrillin-2-like n=1 Tax=Actinia tenebrosa TaxID=6105 RepID=A0A6P8HNV2_ACTTE|nr:fibrillin-2-like [Actinia tenebrosa]
METFLTAFRSLVSLMLMIWTLSTLLKSEAGSCRTLRIKYVFDGKALANHTIRTIQPIADAHTCGTECYLESLCFSYNFCQRPNEAPRCELSQFEHIRKNSHLITKPGCTYYGAISFCAAHKPCRNGATCLGDFLRQNIKYKCICRDGYHGQQCQHDINECSTQKHNCHKNALCVNIAGGFECKCKNNYHGNGTHCEDINECTLPVPPCHVNATCNNTIGGYVCKCKAGFTGNGKDCKDINECLPKPYVCGKVNVTCSISSKTVSRKTNCRPKNSTSGINSTESAVHGNQSNVTGALNCTGCTMHGNHSIATGVLNCTGCTMHGNYGNATDTLNCTECTMHGSHSNTTGAFNCTGCTMHGNHSIATVVSNCTECTMHGNYGNATGTLNCKECTMHETPVKIKQMVVRIEEEEEEECDIEESIVNINDTSSKMCEEDKTCLMFSHGCHVQASCSNDIGSYHCKCNAGFQGNGKNCTDINECASSISVCHNNASCLNTFGGYNCTCLNGFQGNGTFCEDIDECNSDNHGCHVNATCSNTIGGHTCACQDGFHGNGTQCYDIDECNVDKHDCHVNATCKNTIGGHMCKCKDGFHGNGTQCNDIDECAGNIYSCHANASCSNTAGGYDCMCKPGFQGNETFCEDINECLTNTHDCHVNASCNNTIGGYQCLCKSFLYGNGTFCREPETCHELASNMPDEAKSTLYQIKPKGVGYSVFCMISNVGCGSGTWKLAMKIDSKMHTFIYDSPLWTNTDLFKPEAGLTGLDNNETKTQAYWDGRVRKLCLGMKFNGVIRWRRITFSTNTYSLSSWMMYSLYTGVGYDWWKRLLPSTSVHNPRCSREGLNHMISSSRALRIGFFASKVNRAQCSDYNSYIGLGPRLIYLPNDAPICGNYAPSDAYLGARKTHAFCYILVQS